MISYSYIDTTLDVAMPTPMKHAGLYSSDEPYENTLWGKDYRGDPIPPDAVEYAKKYDKVAQNHIPTSVRPGNNTVLNNPFTFSSKNFNSLCFAPHVNENKK